MVKSQFSMKMANATFIKQCVTLRGHARFQQNRAWYNVSPPRFSAPMRKLSRRLSKAEKDTPKRTKARKVVARVHETNI